MKHAARSLAVSRYVPATLCAPLPSCYTPHAALPCCCLCNLDFLGLVWFGSFINWLPSNCNWHSLASRSATWRCTLDQRDFDLDLDLELKLELKLKLKLKQGTWRPLPGHGHGTSLPFRWNVEMKWYALIKNELTQHAANANANADVNVDVVVDSNFNASAAADFDGPFNVFIFIVVFPYASLVFSCSSGVL